MDNSADSDSPVSPIDRSALPVAYLVPSNRPALLAISKTREEGSTYHRNFVAEIRYRGCPTTPCFELALGGLPGVEWRIGKGADEFENNGVDLLLVTDDEDIASVHASFGWTIPEPGLRLIILNEKHKRCTINGHDFSYGNQAIPPKNTILIGDCAFTLLFTPRTCAAETVFQTELRNYVLRLIELHGSEGTEDSALTNLTNNDLKRGRSVDHEEDVQGAFENKDDPRFHKRAKS